MFYIILLISQTKLFLNLTVSIVEFFDTLIELFPCIFNILMGFWKLISMHFFEVIAQFSFISLFLPLFCITTRCYELISFELIIKNCNYFLRVKAINMRLWDIFDLHNFSIAIGSYMAREWSNLFSEFSLTNYSKMRFNLQFLRASHVEEKGIVTFIKIQIRGSIYVSVCA